MKIFLSAKQSRRLNGRGENELVELVYLVNGIADGTPDEEVLRAVGRKSPSEFGSARRDSVSIARRLSRSEMEVVVKYDSELYRGADHSSRCKRAGDEIWLFSALKRREMRYIANSTRKFSRAGASAPEPGPWVNWNGAGGSEFAVSGCEVAAPVMQEKCFRTFKPGDVTNTYKRAVMELIGKTNKYAFHGWSPGEVLFVDVDQSRVYRNGRGDWLTDVIFTFAVAPNRAQVDVFDGITLENVTGWEAIWARPALDPDSGAAIIAGAYASKIYSSGDFGILKIARSDSGAALRDRVVANKIEEE